MTTFIIAWILVTSGATGPISYSPTMAEEDSCQKLKEATQRVAEKSGNKIPAMECVQVHIKTRSW